MKHLASFFRRPVWQDERTPMLIWFVLAIVSALTKVHRCNNFLIFRGVYDHMIQELPLFAYYPDEYNDVNHCGIVFGLLMAPFSVLPVEPSLVMWTITLATSLFIAVQHLPASGIGKTSLHLFVYYFCAHELLTALFMQQFNIAIAAIMLAAFILVEKERDEWATLLIMLGAFIKINSIMALVFLLFSRHKVRFILTSILWTIILTVLPMTVASPEYVLNTYTDWAIELFRKNSGNAASIAQNISVHGLFTRALMLPVPYFPVFAVGCLLFLAPLARVEQWRHIAFRYSALANALLFIVLFSSGSESSGYIIALVGVVLWYATCPWQRGRWAIALLVLVFILTSMSTSDLFPRVAKEFVQQHALKALPCTIVYVWLVWEQMTRDYSVSQRKQN